MIKLPTDRYQNEGWAVRARKPHRCEHRDTGCKGINSGEYYYRAIAWPGHEANDGPAPWVIKICRHCLHGPRQVQFDEAIRQHKEATA